MVGRAVRLMLAGALAGGLCIAAALGATPVTRAATVPVRVLIPDADNLQYLSFWIALGAGYFRDEGLAVRIVTPLAPGTAG